MKEKMMNKENIEYRMRTCLIALTFIALAIFPSFSIADDNPSAKLTIYTVNYPLKYFAERIAGEYAKVIFPAPKDGDPAYWIPDRKIISDYQKADLILLNGAHYAKWTEKVSLPGSKMVDTSRKFKDQYIKTDEAVTHSHGPGGKHAHENTAFTIWLNLDLAARQAKAIKLALIRKRPELRSAFERNYTALQKDLMTLDRKIKEVVSKNENQPFIASHPVYQYFAGRYGLNMKSVHWEPDETPNVSQRTELKRLLKDHKARWMVWEGEPTADSTGMLKSLNVNSLVFEPCGNIPEEGDFLSVMRKNIENLKLAF